MRIAFFTHYARMYGANRSLLNLIEGLINREVRVIVFVPEQGDLCKILASKGIEYHVCPFRWGMSRRNQNNTLWNKIKYYRGVFGRIRENIKVTPKVLKILHVWKADVIYSNASVIYFGLLIAKILRKPHVWHFREFGDLDFNLRMDLGNKFFTFLQQRSEAIICISESVKKHHRLENAPNVHLVYNGVAFRESFNFYRNNYQSYIPNEDFQFLIVGRLNDKKGQEVAIEALATVINRCYKSKLLIAGSGKRDGLMKMISEYALEKHVSFLGFLDDPFEAYTLVDATLVCSTYEAMGRVAVESMAAMKPVIGFDAYGTSELIEHEKTGLLYKDGPEDLARQMIWLIENPDLANEIALNAWKEAKEKYSIEHYADQMFQVIKANRKDRS